MINQSRSNFPSGGVAPPWERPCRLKHKHLRRGKLGCLRSRRQKSSSDCNSYTAGSTSVNTAEVRSGRVDRLEVVVGPGKMVGEFSSFPLCTSSVPAGLIWLSMVINITQLSGFRLAVHEVFFIQGTYCHLSYCIVSYVTVCKTTTIARKDCPTPN
jgi:hypothetical protein